MLEDDAGKGNRWHRPSVPESAAHVCVKWNGFATHRDRSRGSGQRAVFRITPVTWFGSSVIGRWPRPSRVVQLASGSRRRSFVK
jgi:hypothetical protein